MPGRQAGPLAGRQRRLVTTQNPQVRFVVAGCQGLDHSRDPGRGRAVGDGVHYGAADPDQLEQPRPHPVVVGVDVTGA